MAEIRFWHDLQSGALFTSTKSDSKLGYTIDSKLIQLTKQEYKKLLVEQFANNRRITNKNMKLKPKPKALETKTKFKEGDSVTFDHKDTTYKGVILEIDGEGNATIQDNDDEDQQYEVEVSELKLLKEEGKKSAPVEEEEEEPKKKGKGKGHGLGHLFKKAEKVEFAGGIPLGEHQALVTKIELIETDKGKRVDIELVGTDEEALGKVSKKIHFLEDENGNPTEKGHSYLKADLENLGYDIELVDDDDDFDEMLKSVTKEQPWIDIKVVQRRDKPEYNNIYIQGLCEDQDDKPNLDDIPY